MEKLFSGRYRRLLVLFLICSLLVVGGLVFSAPSVHAASITPHNVANPGGVICSFSQYDTVTTSNEYELIVWKDCVGETYAQVINLSNVTQTMFASITNTAGQHASNTQVVSSNNSIKTSVIEGTFHEACGGISNGPSDCWIAG